MNTRESVFRNWFLFSTRIEFDDGDVMSRCANDKVKIGLLAFLGMCLVLSGILLATNEFFIKKSDETFVIAGNQVVTQGLNNSEENESDNTVIEEKESETGETNTVTQPKNDGINYFTERITDDTEHVKVLGELGLTDDGQDLVVALDELLKKYSKKIGVKAVTIDGARGLSYNSAGTFFMASAVKAPYLLYAYTQIEAGNGSPDEMMKYTGNFYHEGTGVMRYMPVGTTFTLKDIMNYTMRKSDNVGYDMCVSRWGKEGYNQFLAGLGCQSFELSDMTNWVFEGRVDDLLLLWDEIYKFMNNGSESARLLYDSCTFLGQMSDYNFMKNVLPDTLVSQKYGWDNDGYGNCAVVYGENQTYIVAIFMDSSGDGRDQILYRDAVRLIDKILDR